MRRFLVTAVLAFVVLAMLAPPVFAQAPAPKVTITGLFDMASGAGKNFYDGNLTRDNDQEWYARTRFRPDFEFAVGRTKAVLGLEIDLQFGQSGVNDGGFPANNSSFAGGVQTTGCKVNTNGCLDLNTDVGGMIEIKWVYLEFPLTGKDALLPFIPIETMARVGGQPFDTLANYKLSAYATGDFPGVSAITTFTPDIKLNLAYAQLEEQLAGANRGNAQTTSARGEDYAVIVSPELTPFKGLDLKPLYSWFHAQGLTAGGARRNLVNIRTNGGALNLPQARGGGICPGAATSGTPGTLAPLSAPCTNAGALDHQENRHTIGLDSRWRLGPFGLDPTIYYQFGSIDSQEGLGNSTATTAPPGTRKVQADMSAWLIDLIGSFQLGPLLLEARGTYSTGNKARDNLAKSIRYYQPLDTDGNFFAGGWTQFFASGVDYFNQGWTTMGNYVGYDRYGRAQAALRATYSITPALSVYGVVSPIFTAEKVDTDTGSVLASAAGNGTAARTTVSQRSWVEGDSRYLGTELNLGMTWKFAPNVAFDLVGAWLSAGPAFDATECQVGNSATSNCGTGATAGTLVKKEANDAYHAAARIRFSF